jgi:hypothetical protein
LGFLPALLTAAAAVTAAAAGTCPVPAAVLQQFHSKNGPAWLFGQVINVVPGPREERLMTTGMHVVSDISCTKCCALLGWKYVSAGD